MKQRHAPPHPHPLPQRQSLVAQAVESLRESIRAGQWQTHLPGERELCERLQVSRTTVRAALEELQRGGWLEVEQRHRRRIRTKHKKQGGSTRKRVVALLFPSSLQTLHPRTIFVIDAVRDHLARAGFAVETHVQSACFSASPGRALDQLVRDHPAAVWIVFGSREPMQRWFLRQRVPVLVFGSCQPGIDLQSVDADHHAVCHHAGGVLWRKGHKRIAMVLPRNAYGGELDSEQGLRSALKDMPGVKLQMLRHDGTAAHICALVDRALHAPGPPTACLVTHAEHAIAVMTHLMHRGRRIPQDMALISRDDHAFLQFARPAISHYAVNPAQLVRRVALAARQLATTGMLPALKIRLMPKFVPGETV